MRFEIMREKIDTGRIVTIAKNNETFKSRILAALQNVAEKATTIPVEKWAYVPSEKIFQTILPIEELISTFNTRYFEPISETADIMGMKFSEDIPRYHGRQFGIEDNGVHVIMSEEPRHESRLVFICVSENETNPYVFDLLLTLKTRLEHFRIQLELGSKNPSKTKELKDLKFAACHRSVHSDIEDLSCFETWAIAHLDERSYYSEDPFELYGLHQRYMGGYGLRIPSFSKFRCGTDDFSKFFENIEKEDWFIDKFGRVVCKKLLLEGDGDDDGIAGELIIRNMLPQNVTYNICKIKMPIFNHCTMEFIQFVLKDMICK
jgi:hypothetical protein